jgi:hypothetical protein
MGNRGPSSSGSAGAPVWSQSRYLRGLAYRCAVMFTGPAATGARRSADLADRVDRGRAARDSVIGAELASQVEGVLRQVDGDDACGGEVG